MSVYREILAVQSPFDIGSDKNRRKMFSCNYEVVATAPVTDFLREMGKLINTAGLGTFATDMFLGTEAILPETDGPFVTLINTGGEAPESTHDSSLGHTYESLSFQVVTTARSYNDSNTRALAIWRLLDGVRNTTVVA